MIKMQMDRNDILALKKSLNKERSLICYMYPKIFKKSINLNALLG